MVRRQELTALALLGSALLVTGCRPPMLGAASPSHSAAATPTLAQQVRRAERAGPGFLDFCPKYNGRARAYYQLDLPGYKVAKGWCRTEVSRLTGADLVNFTAYWDARAVNQTSGTATFTYRLARNTRPPATPVPILIRQSGTLPW